MSDLSKSDMDRVSEKRQVMNFSVAPSPGEIPPIAESRRSEAIQKFNIRFPKKSPLGGKPDIYAPALDSITYNDKGVPMDPVKINYQDGYKISREYRASTDPTVHNFEEFVEWSKDHLTPDGRSWKLLSINGYKARAIEGGTNIFRDGSNLPSLAVAVVYIEPYLYQVNAPQGVSFDDLSIFTKSVVDAVSNAEIN